MPIVETKPKTMSNVVKREQWADAGFCRETVIFSDAAEQTLVVGTVLGKITATGKYVIALGAASDGSEVPAGIFIGAGTGIEPVLTVPAATETNVLVINQGPAIIGDDQLTLGAGITIQAVADAFKLLNINVDTQFKGSLNNV